MNNVAIVAITKNGLNLGKKIHDKFTHWVLYAPDKFSDDDTHVTWFKPFLVIATMATLFIKSYTYSDIIVSFYSTICYITFRNVDICSS